MHSEEPPLLDRCGRKPSARKRRKSCRAGGIPAKGDVALLLDVCEKDTMRVFGSAGAVFLEGRVFAPPRRSNLGLASLKFIKTGRNYSGPAVPC